MAFPTFRLDNQVAIVTGGSQGIGRSIALGLANAGATVAITARSPEPLRAVAGELEAMGKPGLAIPMDVGDAAAIQCTVTQVLEKYGRLDILVNNAAARVHKRVLDHTLEDWEHVFRVNCTAVLLFSQAAARFMCEHGGGSIINISSQLAQVTAPLRVAYCASKAAVVHMTRVMAVDWAPYNIRVNCIGPGPTDTPFTLAAAKRGEALMTLDKVPMGRRAEADEMIGAVVYLASDASTFVTGDFLIVDGGQTIHWR